MDASDHRRRAAQARIERCDAQLQKPLTKVARLNLVKQLFYRIGYLDALEGGKP